MGTCQNAHIGKRENVYKDSKEKQLWKAPNLVKRHLLAKVKMCKETLRQIMRQIKLQASNLVKR